MNDNYNSETTYESNINQNNNTYNEVEEKKPSRKIWLYILMVVILIIIILLLIKCCGLSKKDMDGDLIKAGKEHYNRSDILPNSPGECSVVTLGKLLDENLISKPKNYEKCDKKDTYVQVCRLESGNYHYTPILSCGDYDVSYNPWTIGKEENLTKDKSDLKFLFLGEEKVVGTKYYYPNDETNPDNVSEYYITTPHEDYDIRDTEGVNAYKWYTEKTSVVYWNNEAYSTTMPEGFPNKGTSKMSEVKYSLTLPASQDGRDIKNATLYRSKQESYAYRYRCSDPMIPEYDIFSNVRCEDRVATNYKVTSVIFYTCDGTNEVSKNTECSSFTTWSPNSCVSDITTGKLCDSSPGYSYTDQTWKWYKDEKVKAYYPSNAKSAAEEKTYYNNSPVKGAIRDDSTSTTAYKYYKLVDTTTGSSLMEETEVETWIPVTSGYVSLDEMLSKFRQAGHQVTSLFDIETNDLLRYNIQLQYRDRK